MISGIADTTILPLPLCNRLQSNPDSKMTMNRFATPFHVLPLTKDPVLLIKEAFDENGLPTPFSVLEGESDDAFK